MVASYTCSVFDTRGILEKETTKGRWLMKVSGSCVRVGFGFIHGRSETETGADTDTESPRV